MLRTWKQFPDCRTALKEVYLVETSQAMRTLQRETLERQKIGLPTGGATNGIEGVQWFDSLEDISRNSKIDSDVFTVLVAHEFFDALPIYLIEACSSTHIFDTCIDQNTHRNAAANGMKYELPQSQIRRIEYSRIVTRFLRSASHGLQSELLTPASSESSRLDTRSFLRDSALKYLLLASKQHAKFPS